MLDILRHITVSSMKYDDIILIPLPLHAIPVYLEDVYTKIQLIIKPMI